ncbi:SRPBCC family protein [Nonomuraea sp. NN258]|uniref:SRPBCC family protein n=1 Tax=Nonomuraea antri TaxID=2730852 RepID=UPI00156A21B9|nr:SRPBCC family protein [Nonomuraea antri]NRQ36816.1 SRPBCC family protein [Nonomuraea antri]
MASVIREIVIDASPEHVWAAVGDFAGGPAKMAPGARTEVLPGEPAVRRLTFADGNVVSERLIARDERARRIVWGWVGDDVAHDNTSMQVFADGETRSRLVWIHDTLPDELTGWLGTAMDRLAPVIQESLRESPA